MKPTHLWNCPIRQFTADGVSVAAEPMPIDDATITRMAAIATHPNAQKILDWQMGLVREQKGLRAKCERLEAKLQAIETAGGLTNDELETLRAFAGETDYSHVARPEIKKLLASHDRLEAEVERLRGLLMAFGFADLECGALPLGSLAVHPTAFEKREAAQKEIYTEARRLAEGATDENRS